MMKLLHLVKWKYETIFTWIQKWIETNLQMIRKCSNKNMLEDQKSLSKKKRVQQMKWHSWVWNEIILFRDSPALFDWSIIGWTIRLLALMNLVSMKIEEKRKKKKLIFLFKIVFLPGAPALLDWSIRGCTIRRRALMNLISLNKIKIKISKNISFQYYYHTLNAL